MREPVRDKVGALLPPRLGRWWLYPLAWCLLAVLLMWWQHHFVWALHHSVSYFYPALKLTLALAVAGLVNDFLLYQNLFRPGRYVYYALAVLVLAGGISMIQFMPAKCNCGGLPAAALAVLAWVGLSTASLYFGWREIGPGRNSQTRLLQQDVELKYLRDQVNPHFLFNTLNSIYALAKQRSEQTPEVVLQLSTLLRYQLESAQLESVTLRKELDFIQDYLLLEDTRLGDRCTIEFELSRQPARYSIYPMLLLPFVENAFKHGANATRKASYIKVSVLVEEDVLSFSVDNSRVPDARTEGTGTGLANVKRRLGLLYPNRHWLNIDDSDAERYVIKLRLHLHDDE